MTWFSSLYQRVMQWSRHRYATFWLLLVSFTESFCFVIPPDVMLAPMALARPDKAWFYAMITTMASVIGGGIGYFIGLYAFHIIEPWIVSFDYMDAYLTVQDWFRRWGGWAIFLAGFTPIPYKLFTIASGALGMALFPFLIGSAVGRGMRFFLVAGLMRWGGASLEAQLHGWIDRIGWAVVIIAVTGYFLLTS